jgi:hypothetical protein
MITGLVTTRNDELFLPFALGSLAPWVDEMVVVDMHSTDRSVDIARGFGARVVNHEPVDYVEPVRAFAVAQCAPGWVMLLDPDEVVPVALARRLREIAAEDSADVVLIPRQNHLFGAALAHSGWGGNQDWQNRFFKQGSLEFSPRVHSPAMPQPRARTTALDYEPAVALAHFSHLDVAQFVEKMNRYTSAAVRSGSTAQSLPRALARATSQVYARLISQRGFRDGWRGVVAAMLMAVDRLVEWAKQREAAEGWGRDQAVARYVAEAEQLVGEYGGDALGRGSSID